MVENHNSSIAKCLLHYFHILLDKLRNQMVWKASPSGENLTPHSICIFPKITPSFGAKNMGNNNKNTITDNQKFSIQKEDTAKHSPHNYQDGCNGIDNIFPAIDCDQFNPNSSHFISIRPCGIAG